MQVTYRGESVARFVYSRASRAWVLDWQLTAGIEQLRSAIDSAYDRSGRFPPVNDVRPGTSFAQQLHPWPVNPYTGRPLTPGRDVIGDYRYTYGRRSFTIAWQNADGEVQSEKFSGPPSP